MQALQAKIRPHFFFNTLNTIAELVATKPAQAEMAIESLAFLFRVSLESDSAFHSLDKEMKLCERYIELDQWRWEKPRDIALDVLIEVPGKWAVPKLILQPLLENALNYAAADHSYVSIDVRETPKHISFKIENSVKQRLDGSGLGMALDNIRERLFVLYDDDHLFKVKDQNDRYIVIMNVPKKLMAKI